MEVKSNYRFNILTFSKLCKIFCLGSPLQVLGSDIRWWEENFIIGQSLEFWANFEKIHLNYDKMKIIEKIWEKLGKNNIYYIERLYVFEERIATGPIEFLRFSKVFISPFKFS